MKATYVSVWDDCDEVRTSCKYDSATGTVWDIESGEEPAGANCCTREYIELPDGEIIEREDFDIDEI